MLKKRGLTAILDLEVEEGEKGEGKK